MEEGLRIWDGGGREGGREEKTKGNVQGKRGGNFYQRCPNRGMVNVE